MSLAPDPHEDDVADAPPAPAAAAIDGDDVPTSTTTPGTPSTTPGTPSTTAGSPSTTAGATTTTAAGSGSAAEAPAPASDGSTAAIGPESEVGGADRPGRAVPESRPRSPRSPAYNKPASAAYAPGPFRSGVGDGAAAPGDDPGDALPPERRRLHWTMAAVVGLIAVTAVAVTLTKGSPEDTRASTTPTPSATAAGRRATQAAGGGDHPATTAPPAAPGRAPAGPSTGPATGGRNNTTIGPSPVATVQSYLAATKARDCPTMVDMLTPDSWRAQGGSRAGAVAACRQGFTTGSTDIEQFTFGAVTLVSLTDDDAVVTVALTRAGRPSRENVRLARINGEWKITLAQ